MADDEEVARLRSRLEELEAEKAKGGKLSGVSPISAPTPDRKVGFLLGVGIFLLPIIFVWFLLRHGYSILSRVVGFGWLVVVLLVFSNPYRIADRLDQTASNLTQAANDIQAPAPSAAPVTPKILLDIQGSGTKTTDAFTTQGDNWKLSYSYDCSSFGQRGNFQIDVKTGSDVYTGIQGVNQLGLSGSDTDSYHAGGTFYLEISSECVWHVTVTG